MAAISNTSRTSSTGSASSNTMQVRAIAGDTLERLCWRVYGRLMLASSLVEQVLLLNHGLADFGAVLPMGTTIILPVVKTATTTREVIQLWD